MAVFTAWVGVEKGVKVRNTIKAPNPLLAVQAAASWAREVFSNVSWRDIGIVFIKKGEAEFLEDADMSHAFKIRDPGVEIAAKIMAWDTEDAYTLLSHLRELEKHCQDMPPDLFGEYVNLADIPTCKPLPNLSLEMYPIWAMDKTGKILHGMPGSFEVADAKV